MNKAVVQLRGGWLEYKDYSNKNKDYKGKNHIFYVSYVLEAGIA